MNATHVYYFTRWDEDPNSYMSCFRTSLEDIACPLDIKWPRDGNLFLSTELLLPEHSTDNLRLGLQLEGHGVLCELFQFSRGRHPRLCYGEVKEKNVLVLADVNTASVTLWVLPKTRANCDFLDRLLVDDASEEKVYWYQWLGYQIGEGLMPRLTD